MSDSIELFDRRRRSFYRGWVVGYSISLVFWVSRFVFKWTGIQSEVLDWILGIGLALTIPLMFYFLMRMDSLRRLARNNAELKALFQDELIKYHEMKAWKYGFISMAACLTVFVILSVFVDLKDTNAVVFTALWVGLGGYHLSFYRMERE